MKISDSQGPCEQLFTLSLEAERKIDIIRSKLYSMCGRVGSLLRHLVADLSTVTAIPGRNLSGSLFQLCHHHFIEHQEGLPDNWQKINKCMKTNNNIHSLYNETGQMGFYLFRVGHEESLSSVEALRCCGIPSPAISSTAFRTSVTCAK